ncbi:MAG: class I SAM-dependent methyltransferase [Deltaproteobacteria bacterium]|nr:class I SAM-dependent methyltransferase [Deltaproteobacteria bacterium]
MRTNAELGDLYNRVYRDGEDKFFSKFSNGADVSEANQLVLSAVDWAGKRVLDVGCGTGRVAAEIAARGARFVTGIDYAEEAISKARKEHSRENLEFRCMTLEAWSEPVDCIISLGTLEHMDSPVLALKVMARALKDNGKVVLTCPCFINIRGLVWMTLQLLQNIPMSLTDIHFLSPFDIEAMAAEAGMILERVDSCDFSKGNGDQMLVDLDKRLQNALRDAGIDNTRVPRLLEWMAKVSRSLALERGGPLMGATGFYLLHKSN